MAFEVIKSIVEAENEAEKIKKDALQKAETIRKEAMLQAEKIIVQITGDAKIAGQKALEKAVVDSQCQVTDIIEEAQKKCDEIVSLAEGRKTQAVDAVIRKVVGADGYS